MMEEVGNSKVIEDTYVDDYDSNLFVLTVCGEPELSLDTIDILDYVTESFDGHVPWNYSKKFFEVVKIDVSSTININELRQSMKHALNEAYRVIRKVNDPKSSKTHDLLNIFVNGDFYIIIQDFINEKESDIEN